jgi:hypothetical protein
MISKTIMAIKVIVLVGMMAGCTPGLTPEQNINLWAAQALAERQACNADPYCSTRRAIHNYARDCDLDIVRNCP